MIRKDETGEVGFCVRCNRPLYPDGNQMLCTDCHAWVRAVEEAGKALMDEERLREHMGKLAQAAEERKTRTFAKYLMQRRNNAKATSEL